jgi:GTPase SAR1 family protein
MGNGLPTGELKLPTVVMFGSGESGKSTLMKQLMNLYGPRFSNEQRLRLVPAIHQSIVEACKLIIKELRAQHNSDGIKIGEDILKAIERVVHSGEENLEPKTGQDIHFLWNKGGFKEILNSSNSVFLSNKGSIEHFLERILEISSPDYLPSDEDLVKTRIRTTGLVTQEFDIENVKFILKDTGGQRSERKKWRNLFDATDVILYATAIGDYDQLCYEDEKSNRIQDSLECFESLVRSKLF